MDPLTALGATTGPHVKVTPEVRKQQMQEYIDLLVFDQEVRALAKRHGVHLTFGCMRQYSIRMDGSDYLLVYIATWNFYSNALSVDDLLPEEVEQCIQHYVTRCRYTDLQSPELRLTRLQVFISFELIDFLADKVPMGQLLDPVSRTIMRSLISFSKHMESIRVA